MPSIAILPGDGIGPEVIAQAIRVIDCLNEKFAADLTYEEAPFGGTAYDLHGSPLPEITLDLARRSDAILLGAIGGPKWEAVERSLRPERGLLGIRSELNLFSNLRPAILYPELADASTLKPEIVSGLDIVIVRELTGGIYFGQPRGIETVTTTAQKGSDALIGTAAPRERRGFNTLEYTESEISRIAHSAFTIAMQRDKRLCSVDKANVLESSELWREIVTDVGSEYPDVELSHMYIDNACMQLIRAPKQFDVIVTGNLFGDILSDAASMLTGSIGMLPSASLDENGKGMYEPVHGSAPDIAGQNIANPIATILSLAMLLRSSFDRADLADFVEVAVRSVLKSGLRTGDIAKPGEPTASTSEMGDAILAAIK